MSHKFTNNDMYDLCTLESSLWKGPERQAHETIIQLRKQLSQAEKKKEAARLPWVMGPAQLPSLKLPLAGRDSQQVARWLYLNDSLQCSSEESRYIKIFFSSSFIIFHVVPKFSLKI